MIHALRIADVPADAEMLYHLGRLFPDAGTYIVKAEGADAREVMFSDPPAEAEGGRMIWDSLFPRPGGYVVGDRDTVFCKAELGPFEEWFLERLRLEAERQFATTRELLRRVVIGFIRDHGGSLTSAERLEEFERLLFDLRQGIRWSQATPLSAEAVAELRRLGFSELQQLDVPGIAYRLGLIDEHLRAAGAAFDWPQALELAARVPLLHSDEVAIAVARQHTAEHLTPVLLREPIAMHEVALAREQRLIRTMAEDAVRREMHPRQFASELFHALDPAGVVRDWDRVARTELMDVRLQGAFEGERRARGWTDKDLIYRTLAANPCTACLRLYRNPDGTLRIYTVAELEAEDAKGLNTGPHAGWHARKGTTHPNELCGRWLTYTPALAGYFSREAPKWRAMMVARGLAEAA